jgi:hypothetical protein
LLRNINACGSQAKDIFAAERELHEVTGTHVDFWTLDVARATCFFLFFGERASIAEGGSSA